MTKFNIELNNVTRDYYQGKFGNRPDLNSVEALQAFGIWNDI